MPSAHHGLVALLLYHTMNKPIQMDQDWRPKNLYEYIDLTKDKPTLYIGDKTISAMYSHILGYLNVCFYKDCRETLTPDIGDFNDFIAKYYSFKESTSGWRNMILVKNSNDEEKALVDFYRLLDLFRNKKSV